MEKPYKEIKCFSLPLVVCNYVLLKENLHTSGCLCAILPAVFVYVIVICHTWAS